MEIKTHQFKRVDLIEISGRIDSAAASQLEAALQEIIAQDRYHIVVDMSRLEYLSSSGLRVLVAALKQVRRWNRGDLRFCNIPERIREVLQMAGLDVLFRIYPSAVEAVGDF